MLELGLKLIDFLFGTKRSKYTKGGQNPDLNLVKGRRLPHYFTSPPQLLRASPQFLLVPVSFWVECVRQKNLFITSSCCALELFKFDFLVIYQRPWLRSASLFNCRVSSAPCGQSLELLNAAPQFPAPQNPQTALVSAHFSPCCVRRGFSESLTLWRSTRAPSCLALTCGTEKMFVISLKIPG